MLRLTRKSVLFLAMVVLFIAALGVYYELSLSNESDQQDDYQVTHEIPKTYDSLTTYLEKYPLSDVPTGDDIKRLITFIDSTDSEAEKTKGYFLLAKIYDLSNEMEKALEYYSKSQQSDYFSDFSEEDRMLIDQKILLYTDLVERRKEPLPDGEEYRIEPEE